MGDPRDSVQWSDVPMGNEERARADLADSAPTGNVVGKPFLRLWFACSNQYGRAYRSPDGTMYLGRCPKCGLTAKFSVGEGGTSERFFKVSC